MNYRHCSGVLFFSFSALNAAFASAADVTVQPAAGSGFVVKDAAGANERFRVQETGAVSLPSVAAAPAQPQGLCMSAAGQLGPCSAGTGGSYTAATGLSLAGTTFSVAPTYRLPQGCAANQIAQWSGTAWACGTAGGGALPPGTVNQTLRYDASNTPVANNLLQAFADGGLVAGGTLNTGSIPATGPGARMMWYPAQAAFRAGYVDGSQWDMGNVGIGSVAMGKNAIAPDEGAVAIGLGASAGYHATALGDATKANGIGSTAMGTNTSAFGIYSTAMGAGTIASGGRSTAIGGEGTTASGSGSVAMGFNTKASGSYSTTMGANTQASGDYSTAMGRTTSAEGNNSTALGYDTKATGNYSTAMGSNAQTDTHEGSFVYGDGSRITQNTGDHQFTVRASGGFVFLSDDSPGGTAGVQLKPGGGAWDNLSDRNAKTAFESVDARDVLARVVSLPLSTWHYKAQDASDRHMGPMAQDFYAAFHLGDSDKSINTIDADGVALAAIQGLNARLDEKDREIASLKLHIAALESLHDDLAEVKKQLAAIRESPSTAVTVALRNP